MGLQFIDQSPSGIGRSDRRIIRSHVMRGKNTGKQLRSIRNQKDVLERKQLLKAGISRYVIPRQVFWGDLCLTTFPRELDSKSTALMHRWFFDISDALFPPRFCTKFDIIKSIWVNYILADEAYFHSTLAISASYVDFFQRKPGISSKTLHHISQAYALVNIKLSGPFSVSDSAIAAVGLYRMIQLRGGIARLMQENRALALKPLRLDIELAIQNGTCTLFRADEVPIHPVLCDPDVSIVQFPKFVPWMPPIMLDLISFSRLLNEAESGQRIKLNPLDYTETLISLLYRLVDVSPLRQSTTKTDGLYDDVTYLALLAFMMTLLPEYTRDGPSCPLLSERLELAMQDFCVTLSDSSESDPYYFLWILFICGISALSPKDYHWLSPLVIGACETLQLDNWSLIQRQLSRFPWIFALHDALGHRLWEDVRLGGK
ncbi:hypothetical protein FE257_010121 [Aspergillus nanangensis]|uniref:Uncharacterized protein n=1 Tax=Aspergillus nanangensis TaxID=2582783 RepID=A0AAD4CJU6_ASPNN|nr:hypothetical protein FE257_010121 [Aspergillus nanangensis]